MYVNDKYIENNRHKTYICCPQIKKKSSFLKLKEGHVFNKKNMKEVLKTMKCQVLSINLCSGLYELVG